MVKHCIYFIIIVLIFFQNVFSDNIITLSFKKDPLDLKGSPPSEIFQKLKENTLLTEIKLGNPSQKIELKLEFTEYIFYIGGKSSFCKNKFIEGDSKTYKKNSDILYFNTFNMRQAYLSSDLFYFNSNTKNSKELKFLLATDTDRINYGGKLGLNIQDTDTKKYDDYNFINILKKNGLIKDFYFFIKYNDDTSGNLIIGDLPHNFDNSYNPKFFKDMYISMSTNVLTWNINVDSVFVADSKDSENKKIVGEKIYGYFKLEFGIILGTERYRLNLLNNFMTDKINKKLCFEEISSFYINYYCKEEADIKKLNNLYFYIKDLDFTFELTYKDLFYKASDGNYYFLIYFNTDYNSEDSSDFFWTFGEPLFKKYNFVFNQDVRRVGLYTSTNNGNNEDILKNESFWSRNKWYIILAISLFIVCGGLGLMIFLYLKVLPKRKTKANELDDDFEYTSKENKIIDN